VFFQDQSGEGRAYSIRADSKFVQTRMFELTVDPPLLTPTPVNAGESVAYLV